MADVTNSLSQSTYSVFSFLILPGKSENFLLSTQVLPKFKFVSVVVINIQLSSRLCTVYSLYLGFTLLL